MQNLTYIVPLRIDSQDRLENADASVAYLQKTFPRSRVIIVEHASKSILGDRWRRLGVSYCFVTSDGPFCKSEAINCGLLSANTEFVCVYDADVLIARNAVSTGLEIMRKRQVKALLPHNTLFVNVAGESRMRLMHTLDLDSMPHVPSLRTALPSKEYRSYPIPSGVVLFDRATLITCGGFNKNMQGYGWEDIEVLKRLNNLGFYYHILGHYNVIHLDHARGFGSQPDPTYFTRNKEEYLAVLRMSRRRLMDYVDMNLKIDPRVTSGALEKLVSDRRRHNRVHVGGIRYFIGKALNYVVIKGIWRLQHAQT